MSCNQVAPPIATATIAMANKKVLRRRTLFDTSVRRADPRSWRPPTTAPTAAPMGMPKHNPNGQQRYAHSKTLHEQNSNKLPPIAPENAPASVDVAETRSPTRAASLQW